MSQQNDQSYEKVTVSGIEFLVRGAQKPEQTIVLFHGYGADAYDLLPLSQVLNLGSGTRWIFPNGIHTVPIGPGYTGRAWFEIDIVAMQMASMTGDFTEFSKTMGDGLNAAQEGVAKAIKDLGVEIQSTVFGGFSQGSMIAIDYVLNTNQNPKGLVVLSGAPALNRSWEEKAKSHQFTFFQSHGRMDPVLPFSGAEALERILISSGLKGRLLAFDGGHEIPQTVLEGLQEYLLTLKGTE